MCLWCPSPDELHRTGTVVIRGRVLGEGTRVEGTGVDAWNQGKLRKRGGFRKEENVGQQSCPALRGRDRPRRRLGHPLIQESLSPRLLVSGSTPDQVSSMKIFSVGLVSATFLSGGRQKVGHRITRFSQTREESELSEMFSVGR